MENVKLKDGFTQVCVWQGTTVVENKLLAAEQIKEFEDLGRWFFGSRFQYLEEIKTNPTPDEPGTGGRTDLFFAVHSEDVGKFAIPRLAYGIRWIEDVYGNESGYLYPERVEQYKSW